MNVTVKTSKDLIGSIITGNFEEVKSHFEEAKSNFDFKYFNKEDKYGLKPIHWACLSSNMDVLKWMLKNKCNIETSSRNGWRSIHFATFTGNEEIVTFLIENFCKLNCQTDNGETVLDVANGDCNHGFIDEILNENINLKIGLSIGLKCGADCDHTFCLKSVIQCNFQRNEQIGWGVFTNIYKVKDSQNDRQFAMRIIKQRVYNSLSNKNCILVKINQILPNITHSKILKYFGMIETRSEMILLMEFMNNGTLHDEIHLIGTSINDKIGRYSKDILEAVTFLHGNKILHRSIHPKNIFINNNGGCKLAISNFTCSLADEEVRVNNDEDNYYDYDDDLWEFDYTYPFEAPEMLKCEILSYPYDIFCLGCTVIEISTSEYIEYRWNFIDTIDETISEIPNEILQSFIKSMLMENPTDRATANELMNDEFIRNLSIDNSNYDQSINNNYLINRKNSFNLLQNAIDNKQIGLSMKLKCEEKCQHEFCLSSVVATNFKKGENIGEGSCGKVFKIKLKSGEHWAMKIIKNVADENIKEEAKYFENDINQCRELINHDNIVKYFGAIRNLKEIFIFMEFINGESLYQKIKKINFKPLPLITIKNYTKQILVGLKFLHNLKIIHQNIKSANIFINNNDIVKIADFGLNRFLRTISKNQRKIFCGTPNYMAPEIIIDEPCDCSADIWSLGATVFEMATGSPPFNEIHENFAMIFKIGTTRKVEYPSNMSDDLKGFLNLMMNVNPKNRPSAESLLCGGFLNGIN